MHFCARILRFPFCKGLRRIQAKLFSTVPEPKDKKENAPANADVANFVSPLRHPDYFGINNFFTIKDLFDARVHMGHKEGSLDNRMLPFIFGSRLGHLIFDLEQTKFHLRQALNVVAHTSYRGGIICFISNYHQHCTLIENTAKECSEFAHTRKFIQGTFLDSTKKFKAFIRLPDMCIILNTLNDVLAEHPAVVECAKMNIPTIAILDSNCNPNLITYPVPGNDDSVIAMELYCKLFKEAILKGKEERCKVLQ